MLQAPIKELRKRAWARLRKKGMVVPPYDEGAHLALTVMLALREPYTVCFLVVSYKSETLEALGVAKRNPVDRRDLSIGATLAVYRAWRDFWIQTVWVEKKRETAARDVVEKMEDRVGAVSETPF